jgi:hypothetical protein
MRARRCSDCERPLLPHEQGTLCSPCLYGYICGAGPDAEASIGGKAPTPGPLPRTGGDRPSMPRHPDG